MIYLEKVIDDRISELEEQRINLIVETTKKLLYGGFNPDVDFSELGLDLDEIYFRKDELKKLKKGLGIIPVSDIKVDAEKIENIA